MPKDNLGAAMKDGFQDDDTELEPIAGEAHWQLAYAERHNGVFKAAVVEGLKLNNPQSEEEYLAMIDQILENKNRFVRRLGHSPQRVAFGKDPKVPDSLLDEGCSIPVNDSVLLDPPFQNTQRMRLNCRIAVLKADDNESVRQTLCTRPRPHQEFCVGD